MSLTHRQRDALAFIYRYQQDNLGVTPSYQEITEQLGLASKSSTYRLLQGLEGRGYISIIPHKARAIDILEMPSGLKASVTEPNQMDRTLAARGDVITLPVYTLESLVTSQHTKGITT